MTNQFKMKEGTPEMSECPVIEVLGKGHRTYLWVGNETKSAKVECYATLSGRSALTKLVKALREAMK